MDCILFHVKFQDGLSIFVWSNMANLYKKKLEFKTDEFPKVPQMFKNRRHPPTSSASHPSRGNFMGECYRQNYREELNESRCLKTKVGISNRLVGRTERPKRMVPEVRGVYRRRYKKR
jgi:hypothetical protein